MKVSTHSYSVLLSKGLRSLEGQGQGHKCQGHEMSQVDGTALSAEAVGGAGGVRQQEGNVKGGSLGPPLSTVM